MKKRYIVAAIVLVGIGLSVLPLFASTISADYRQVSTEVGPGIVLEEADTQGKIGDCMMMGVSARYDYHGFPFVTYMPGDVCSWPKVLYPSGIALNFLIAFGLVLAVATIVKRSKG